MSSREEGKGREGRGGVFFALCDGQTAVVSFSIIKEKKKRKKERKERNVPLSFLGEKKGRGGERRRHE